MSTNAQEDAERALTQLVRLSVLTEALARARTPEELATIVVEKGEVALGAAVSSFVRLEGDTMGRLVEDLLDVSRIISGKMRLDVQSIAIDSALDAATESMKPALDAKAILLRTERDPEIDHVIGDPARLQQIFWDLLSNAVRFTPNGGAITVRLRRVDAGIEVTVEDSGSGIDQDFLPYVFEPFRQEDASHARKRGGLGLGLAITRQLVELHGGTITAHSAGHGLGATFTIILPRAARPA